MAVDCEARLIEAEARIAELEGENRYLRESLDGSKHDAVLTFDTVSMVLKATNPGRETLEFIDQSKKSIEMADDEDRTGIALAKTRAAAIMIKDAAPPAAASDDEDKPYSYTVKSRVEHRGDALLDRMSRYGKRALKTTEAQVLLQEVEGGELDPTVVYRAMRYVAKKTGGKLDKIGGVLRLIVPGKTQVKTTATAEPTEKRTPKLGGGFAGLIPDGTVDMVSTLRGGGTPGG